MAPTRKQYTATFKVRVAIEAIRGEKTLNRLGSQFGLHPVQIAHWRRTALDHIEDLFVDGRTRRAKTRRPRRTGTRCLKRLAG